MDSGGSTLQQLVQKVLLNKIIGCIQRREREVQYKTIVGENLSTIWQWVLNNSLKFFKLIEMLLIDIRLRTFVIVVEFLTTFIGSWIWL